MMIKDVAVVILNWNGINHLKEFLPSVVNHTNNNIADVWVIDNASTDESVQFLKENYPSIKIIVNKEKWRFCKGL